MYFLSYHSTLHLGDSLQPLFDAMASVVWYLTAFLATGSIVPNHGIIPASAQYMLGLGEFFFSDTIINNVNLQQGIGDITG